MFLLSLWRMSTKFKTILVFGFISVNSSTADLGPYIQFNSLFPAMHNIQVKEVMGHFTARSLHSLKPSVTSQPIQNKLNLISVTSQAIIYL